MLKATLPKPPSLNHIYATRVFKGHSMTYITKAGQDWFQEAGWLLKSQMKIREPLAVPLRVSIHLYTARRQDIDNIVKPIFDALTKSGVIEDDHHIVTLSVEKFRVPHIPEERVVVMVAPAAPGLTIVEETVEEIKL